MRFFIVAVLLFSILPAWTQVGKITVHGTVIDEDGIQIRTPTVVVAGTSQRILPSITGAFTVTLNLADSLFIFSPGHKATYINFRDSLPGSEVWVRVQLEPMSYVLPDAVIRADKPMYQIKEDIENLEKKKTNVYKKIAITSPITALWEKFSAREKEKRAVAELEYRQEIKNIIADLLRAYVKSDIVEYLEEDDILLLADRIEVPEWLLKSASDYDLAVFIKKQVQEYLAE